MVPSADPYWSAHTHSVHSVYDALPQVPAMVARSVELGYPALGLTDHRSVSGSIQLYKACRKAGIEPLPGIELDVYPDTSQFQRKPKYHLTVLSYNERGYRNLVRLATLSAQKFWYLPRVDFADLAQMAEDGATQGLAVATGCFFGVLPQTLMRQGPEAAVHVAQTLAGWFPRVYVELQNHGIEEHGSRIAEDMPWTAGWTDDSLLEQVWWVAERAGLPVVVTRDSHYIDEADKAKHEALKQLMTFSEDPDEALFPGDGYFMTDERGLRPFFPPKMVSAGIDGLTELANVAYVRLPELENFKLKVPDIGLDGDPQKILEAKVRATLTPKEVADPATMRWLHDELDVWRSSGMATYALLVDGVCEFMRERGIRYIARGSASGSFVLYKLKVTQEHPIKMGLRFDRFLSVNRLKPPDVDLDVEHHRRDEVIVEYLTRKYYVCPVGNHRKLSLYSADEDGELSRGSIKERFHTVMSKRGTPVDWSRVPKKDKDMLFALSDLNLIAGYGRHAAGYIVAPNQQVLDDLPKARITSNKVLVTAYGKKDVEQLGFLKLDLLGAKMQTAIAHMESLAGISFLDIPDNDPQTYRMISLGDVDSVFQFDGGATRIGARRIRPRKFEDIIAIQALFRPAPMKSGWTDTYIRRRDRLEPVPVQHPDIMSITKDTHGILLYQEQVLDVIRTLGATQLEMESMLDAVKASNEYSIGAAEALAEMMPRIEELAIARGWSEADISWLVKGLASYADYSFGRAHAVSYGRVAYRTAWMKKHHQLVFWCAILRAYEDSETVVVTRKTNQARRDGVGFLTPHVNRSLSTYTIDAEKNRIRRGLLSVPGIGPRSAAVLQKQAPFTDLTDLAQRVGSGITGSIKLVQGVHPAQCGGMISALHEARALEGLEHRHD
jgi:DNA polymerase-3 subunit alpha